LQRMLGVAGAGAASLGRPGALHRVDLMVSVFQCFILRGVPVTLRSSYCARLRVVVIAASGVAALPTAYVRRGGSRAHAGTVSLTLPVGTLKPRLAVKTSLILHVP